MIIEKTLPMLRGAEVGAVDADSEVDTEGGASEGDLEVDSEAGVEWEGGVSIS